MIKKANTLYLNLKSGYFDQINSGEKMYEYRMVTPYWTKRLHNRNYENIVLRKGYPDSNDWLRQIIRPWRGCEVQTITHPHFGPKPVQVYAIKVNEEA